MEERIFYCGGCAKPHSIWLKAGTFLASWWQDDCEICREKVKERHDAINRFDEEVIK